MDVLCLAFANHSLEAYCEFLSFFCRFIDMDCKQLVAYIYELCVIVRQPMYKGEETKGIDFYNLLFESDEFTAELGKVSLAAGKLEAELILFLRKNGVTKNLQKATLGGLITKAKEKNLFDKNLITCLEMVCRQRNYVTHNIYALFINLLDETILEKNNLIDTDVITYIERAWQLRENLNEMARVIQKRTTTHNRGTCCTTSIFSR